MRAPKDRLRGTPFFYLVDPEQLDGLDEWAEWLESILHGPCMVVEDHGELVLAEIRARVAQIDGLRIEIYPNDHSPPHFHVTSPNVDACLAIEDCRKLRGTLSDADFRKIRYWHKHSKRILLERWASTRPTDCAVTKHRGA